MKIIDAHTHIDSVLKPWQPNVVAVVCCATNESDWLNLDDVCKNNKRVYGAFGIHPWFVNTVQDNFDVRLENLMLKNARYMIGEIGLDKYHPDMDKQIDVFATQLNLAIKLHRNVFIHCVGAWDKMLNVFKNCKNLNSPIFVIHAFNENDDILNKLLMYENIMFSIGKNALCSEKCRIDKIPSNRILIESDGKSDVLLNDIMNKIIQIKNDKNIPDIIYNNTAKVLNHE